MADGTWYEQRARECEGVSRALQGEIGQLEGQESSALSSVGELRRELAELGAARRTLAMEFRELDATCADVAREGAQMGTLPDNRVVESASERVQERARGTLARRVQVLADEADGRVARAIAQVEREIEEAEGLLASVRSSLEAARGQLLRSNERARGYWQLAAAAWAQG